MAPDLRPLADEIASRADEILVSGSDRAQARAGLAELLALDYPFLESEHRALVINAVIALLEEDDYFGIEFVGDPFSEDDDADPS